MPQSPVEPLIVLESVHLKLASMAGEVNVLRGIDLSVAAGETVGIVGPSGSGKSTMLMVIAGLERATAGRVRVAGADLSDLDEDRLATFRRDNVGIVFQAFHLMQTMTALENVAVPLELAGDRGAFARARELLAAVGLEQRLEHYPGQLSGANSSASPWPAPSRPAPASCWPTSRRAISTARPAATSSTCCSTSIPGTERPCC